MKLYQEIKDIITKQLGIVDLSTYKKYVEGSYKREPSKEELELLSPDNIHNGDYWRVIEELFGTDCVSNTNYGTYDDDIMESNRRNHQIALTTGMLIPINALQKYAASLLEIGPGYGSFKNYVETNSLFKYTGVDVYPKMPKIISTTPEGYLPEEILKKRYNLVYSSNVFQHLSNKQRRKYFEDIHFILEENGYFVFNLLVISHTSLANKNIYLRHYGQYTLIPYIGDVRNELSKYFDFVSELYRFSDGLITFHCQKKKAPEENQQIPLTKTENSPIMEA